MFVGLHELVLILGVGVGTQLDKTTQALVDAHEGGIKRLKLRRAQARELWAAHKPASSKGRIASFAILVLTWLVVVSALTGDGLRRAPAETIVSSATFLPATNLIASPSNFSGISQRAEESRSWPPNLTSAVDPESFPPLLNDGSQEKKQDAGGIPSLEEFRRGVMNGNANQLTGIWVEDILAFRVQAGLTTYAPTSDDALSIYRWAWEHGVVGLLIHDYRGGTKLYQLYPGTMIAAIYGNGGVDWYVSRGGTWYEAKTVSSRGFAGPFRTWSCTECDFDLTVQNLRQRHYAGNHHLAFQTCVTAGGRMGFVIIEAYLADVQPLPQDADENLETWKRIQFE